MTPLANLDQAEAFLGQAGPRWIFKHSSTCPVSTAAFEEVSAFTDSDTGTGDLPVGLVVVQEARPVSNWLATRLAYVHQSPQLFLVNGGKVLWQASHWGITAQKMAAALSAKA
jgi:bacillithiol system protein YtxJ